MRLRSATEVKIEECGQISAAVRCEELIGKQRGMFVDRREHVLWSGRIEDLSEIQLENLERSILECHPDLALEPGAVVIDGEVRPVETPST